MIHRWKNPTSSSEWTSTVRPRSSPNRRCVSLSRKWPTSTSASSSTKASWHPILTTVYIRSSMISLRETSAIIRQFSTFWPVIPKRTSVPSRYCFLSVLLDSISFDFFHLFFSPHQGPERSSQDGNIPNADQQIRGVGVGRRGEEPETVRCYQADAHLDSALLPWRQPQRHHHPAGHYRRAGHLHRILSPAATGWTQPNLGTSISVFTSRFYQQPTWW